MFAGYKTGEGIPEDLLVQFEMAERAVASRGIVVWPMVEFEADDAMATAADDRVSSRSLRGHQRRVEPRAEVVSGPNCRAKTLRNLSAARNVACSDAADAAGNY